MMTPVRRLWHTLTGIGADSSPGRRGTLILARRLLAVAVMLGAWLVLRVSATARR